MRSGWRWRCRSHAAAFAVEGVVRGLPDPYVVPRLGRDPETDVVDETCAVRRNDDLHALGGLQRLEGGEGRLVDHVDVAGLDAEHPGLVVGDVQQVYLVEQRKTFTPVVLVPFQDDDLVPVPTDELERTGPDQDVRLEFPAFLPYIDIHEGFGDEGVRSAQCHVDRVVVDGSRVLHE